MSDDHAIICYKCSILYVIFLPLSYKLIVLTKSIDCLSNKNTKKKFLKILIGGYLVNLILK